MVDFDQVISSVGILEVDGRKTFTATCQAVGPNERVLAAKGRKIGPFTFGSVNTFIYEMKNYVGERAPQVLKIDPPASIPQIRCRV